MDSKSNIRTALDDGKGQQQGIRRNDNGDGRHDDGKGQQGNRRHDNGDGRNDDGKGQQGDRRHNNSNGWHDNWRHNDKAMARGSRAIGGTTAVMGGTTTVTGGKTTGGTMMARGRKWQQHHHHQRTNCSTIMNTFASPDNLDLFKLIYSI